ncbi:MAG: ATP-binding protein [Spirochaetaceae bacterium]|jgi:hypothetical protein|nr:ATP-binding protein [Spirochaetaceae bacterium]
MHYTLCDLFTDLTQNAIEAGSSRITVEFTETETHLTVYIRDNGKGIAPEDMKKVKDPFYTDGKKHPNRKVGLGIPFLIQTASSTGGEWDITSKPGAGTTVFCRIDMTHIDTPPVGSITGFFRQILTFPESYEMEIVRKRTAKNGALDYRILRSELIDALGSLDDAESMVLLGSYLEGLEEG